MIFFINQKLSFSYYKKLRAWYFFKNINASLGRNVRIFGLAYKINLGKNVVFYDNVIIEFGPHSEVYIGNNSLFSYGVLIAVNLKISIGNDVQIGEYTSIRDTTHQYNNIELPIKLSGDISTPIVIGDDVWIGRGCLIMPGTVIENGVVVGANSIVKGLLVKNGIYAGSPCKFIKFRFSQNN